jgi:hypothetical protein
MTIQNLIIILLILVIIGILVFSFRYITIEDRKKKEKLKNQPSPPSDQKSGSALRIVQDNELSKEMMKIIENKKSKFLKIPNIIFHFADKDQITQIYNDYFKEPTIESFVSEITGEVGKEIKANIPQIMESQIGSKDSNKSVRKIKVPEITISYMFSRYQREIINKQEVALGIEEIDIELTDVEAFNSSIKEIENRFGLKFQDKELKNYRDQLKEKAAERTLTKLEQVPDWVLIEGRFEITYENNYYKCTYLHPVSQYLTKQMKPITISVLIPKEKLEPHISGNYAQSIGKSIRLRVYGHLWQPIDRHTGNLDLQLTPIAVY